MAYRMLSFLLKLISYIPFKVLYLISDSLFYPLYYVARYRRNVTRKNLSECFPDKTDRELNDIEKGFYRFFVDNILETCKMAHMSAKEMGRRMKFININIVNEVLRSGRSISLFLGHYGNWEWISSMPLHLEKSAVAAQIYHRLDNKDVDRLMLDMRGRMGAVSVEMSNTARYITGLVAAHKVCIVGFIADQSPRRKDSHHYLEFLNHMVPVLTGTEKITKHYGFEAYFAHTRRVKRGFYEVEFVKMTDNPKLLPDFDLTSIYYRLLQNMIEENPELYLWTHKRFRYARPLDGQPEEKRTVCKN